MTKFIIEYGKLDNPATDIFTSNSFDIYQKLNPEYFDSINTFECFKPCLKRILEAHNQKDINITTITNPNFCKLEKNKKVLLAFSGGLDSIYQALSLREQGYEVILFHCKNMNYYANGQEAKIVESFSKKYSFEVVYSNISPDWKSTTYKKFWKENSWKDMLFYSMMLDYCIENNIYYISSGDDLHLSIKDAVIGTNLSDSFELTSLFIKGISHVTNIEFIFVNPLEHKGDRLKKLIENNALDDYYSCVNPGKFNQLNHRKVEEKYNVKLEKYNCGICRKCAFHSLLRHYYLNEPFNKDFINYCWTKIAIGADNVFFNENIPLETRIKNLFDY